MDSVFGKKNIINLEEHNDLIRKIVRNNRLVLFIGAGLSRIGGCKSWIELAKDLTKKLCEIDNSINFAEKNELLKIAETNPKKTITIVYKKFKEKGKDKEYYNVLLKAVEPEEDRDKAKFKKIHDKVKELNARCYITTNYDNGLELVLPHRDIENLTDLNNLQKNIEFTEGDFKDEKIYYLHGSKDIPENIILTHEQYYNFYNSSESTIVKNFLDELLSGKHTILFIGYGLEEYELLQHLFLNKSNDKSQKHILLSPIFSKDITRFNLEKIFFNLHGVTAIPYNIDTRGYEILSDVIDDLKEKFNEYKIDKLNKIDSALSINDLTIVNELNNNLEEDYFFDKVSSPLYFDKIKSEGFFKPERIAAPISTKENNSYESSYWNISKYLLKLSDQIKKEPDKNKHLIEEIIHIINEVTDYYGNSQDGGQKSNFNHWQIFVRVISNLPYQYITKNFLSNLSTWVKTSTAPTVVMKYTEEMLLPSLYSDPEVNDKIEVILTGLLQINSIKDKFGNEEKEFFVHNYSLNKLLNKNLKLLVDKLDISFVKYLTKLITGDVGKTGLLKGKQEESYLSIYEEKFIRKEPLKTVFYLLKKFIYAKMESEDITNCIILLMNNEYYIIKKLALYLISKDENYKNLFFNYISKNDDIITDYPFFGDELKELFSKFKRLDEKEILLLNKRIESITIEHFLENRKEKTIKSKYIFYKALKHIKFFNKKYNEYRAKVKYKDMELTALVIPYGEAYIVKTETPEREDDLLLKIEEGCFWNHIKGFKTIFNSKTPKVQLDYDGFLNIKARKKPDFMVKKLLKKNILKEIIPEEKYINSILYGLEETIQEDNTTFNMWNLLIEFFIEYYDKGKREFIKPLGNCFYHAFTKNKITIDKQFIKNFEQLYSKIIEGVDPYKTNILSNKTKPAFEIATESINSDLGVSLEVILFYTLSHERENYRGREKEFQKTIQAKYVKEMFNSFLSKKSKSAYYIFGNYLINFTYIDENWTFETIDTIKNAEYDLWYAFISGHSFNMRVNFELMKNMYHHYKRFFNLKNEPSSESSGVIAGSSFKAYVFEVPKFSELVELTYENIYRIHDTLLYFSYIYRDIRGTDEEQKFEIKIFQYFEEIINRYRENKFSHWDEKNIRLMFKYMQYLFDYIEKIDDRIENIILNSLIKHNHEGDNYDLIEFLNKVKDKNEIEKSLNFIHKVISKLYENNSLSDFYIHEIKDLIEYFYMNGKNKKEIYNIANDICEIYAKAGFFFLKPIYDKYNKN